MDLIKKDKLPRKDIPGRKIWTAFGAEGIFKSDKMTYGYARFSPESGLAETHNHAEELVYVIDCNTAYTRFGWEKDKLGEKVYLKPGDTLHFENLEWHIFSYDDMETGYLDILFFYPTLNNVRPEDNAKNT